MARLVGVKPMEFKLYAPQAKRVSIAGSFNKWDLGALAAKKDSKGNWKAKVNLKPGKYEYKYIVDGSWINDPCNASSITNSLGTQNSIIEIK